MHNAPAPDRLLQPGEPPPVRVDNPAGRSPFLILCDHAGRVVPQRLGDLGVPAAEMDRHIAYDIGCEAVSLQMSEALDAVLIRQTYSRLVIDCNRTPGHPTSVPPVSDGTAVPGNVGLPPEAIAARVREIFDPYQDAVAAELDRRAAAGQPAIVIGMHSFTPVYGGVTRPWQAGILHDRDPEFGLALGEVLREAGFLVGDNEPYTLTDESDYTIPVHAERRRLPYVELEIRQDLIATATGQADWAALLVRSLPLAAARLDLPS
ncbi:MAG: N-formylglutamate amidohydrolase [Janthinobacterium lividum]